MHAAELIYTKAVQATNNEQLRRAAGISAEADPTRLAHLLLSAHSDQYTSAISGTPNASWNIVRLTRTPT